MKPLDYARGRCQRDEKPKEQSWTPVYEPGPIQRALGWAWEIVCWFRFW